MGIKNLGKVEKSHKKKPGKAGIEITWNGKTQEVSAWAKESGSSEMAIRSRLKRGLCIKEVIFGDGRKKQERHGAEQSQEYTAWRAMVERCENKNHKHYCNYGGRGISVCHSWRNSFKAFLNDMGLRPNGCTIDRIDVNSGYCKENCRWATRAEQARNKRNNRFLTHDGRTQCLSDWAAEKGSPITRICDRIDKLGWTVDDAISTDRIDGRIITVHGVSRTVTAWAKERGFDRCIIKDRLRMGWSEEDAVMKPVKKLDRNGLFFNGKTQSKVAWSKETGIPRETIGKRLKYGWSVEKTLTTPVARKTK